MSRFFRHNWFTRLLWKFTLSNIDMAQRKIEVNEDDFKKLMLMLKYSKEFIKLDPTDLFLGNLWRVAPKMADKLVRKAGYVFVENKGRKTLKYESEVEVEVEVPEVNTEDAETGRVDSTKPTKANKPKDEKPAPDPEPAPTTVEDKPTEDSPKPDTGSEEPKEEVRVPRCRKRKNKK